MLSLFAPPYLHRLSTRRSCVLRSYVVRMSGVRNNAIVPPRRKVCDAGGITDGIRSAYVRACAACMIGQQPRRLHEATRGNTAREHDPKMDGQMCAPGHECAYVCRR